MVNNLPRLAIIGGTGALGGGLAIRWARAGYPVIIGSRSSEKAVENGGDKIVHRSGGISLPWAE